MSNSRKTLLAGPYVGEFGWELFGWQGYIRALSREYDETIIISRPGNRYFYQDFCSEYHTYLPSGNKTNYTKCKDDKLPDNYYDKFTFTGLIPSQTMFARWHPSKGMRGFNRKFIPEGLESEYIRYGTPDHEYGYDILVHARSTCKLGSGFRNWPEYRWMELVGGLMDDFRVASIGRSSSAIHVEGSDDMRDLDAEELCDLIAGSTLVAGPSSGPMHLASLCGTPHLVWSDKINRRRYLEHWNPFNTQCIFYSDDRWHPGAGKIEKIIRKFFLTL